MVAFGKPVLFHGRVLLPVAFVLATVMVYGQSPSQSPEYITFRVDAERVIANVLVRGVGSSPQVRDGLSEPPVARFGYEYFEPPDEWGDLPNEHKVGDPWVIHTAPGQVFQATVERRVGGYLGCEEAVGILLRVAPQQATLFGAVRARYFVAAPTLGSAPGATALPSAVRILPAFALTSNLRQSLESVLDETLARELPRVRSEAARSLARALDSTSRRRRSWARERLQIEDAMELGRSRPQYDVQAFQLSPDEVPRLFVRAQWIVGWRQGFAAALWLKAGEPIEVLETNVRPAEMLRIGEFQGAVSLEHMGLILNVLDRNGDGWGEVIFASAGYESRSTSLLEFSPAGFHKTKIELTGGC